MKPHSAPALDIDHLAALTAQVQQLSAIVTVLNARLAEIEHRLEKDRAVQPVGPSWLGAKDAAFYAGVSLSRIYQLARGGGEIKSRRIGGRVLVDRSTLPHCKVTQPL
jgi:hypothetical protein